MQLFGKEYYRQEEVRATSGVLEEANVAEAK